MSAPHVRLACLPYLCQQFSQKLVEIFDKNSLHIFRRGVVNVVYLFTECICRVVLRRIEWCSYA